MQTGAASPMRLRRLHDGAYERTRVRSKAAPRSATYRLYNRNNITLRDCQVLQECPSRWGSFVTEGRSMNHGEFHDPSSNGAAHVHSHAPAEFGLAFALGTA